MRFSIRSQRGQMLEAFLAAVILAVVMVAIAGIIARHSQTTVKIKKFDQSKLLADMVLEQYNSWNGGPAMQANDKPTFVRPGVFFNSGTNDWGFPDFRLTTQTSCAASNSNCTVTLKVRSPLGDVRTYSRIYDTQMINNTGATVDVWVLDPVTCNPAAPTTFPTCGGKAGFQVTASASAIVGYKNLFGTPEVVSYTQANGHAVLRNVSTTVPVVVTARCPGSSVAADPSVSFVQGYYVAGSTQATAYNPPQTFAKVPTTITDNIVVFTNFLPLGTVTGSLSNIGGGTNQNMMVVLQSTASTGFGLQYNPTWNQLTDGGGNFTFQNVLPGALRLYAAGDPGSEVAVPPSDPKFRQGYSNPNFYPLTLPTPTSLSSPPLLSGVSVTVQKLGALHLNVSGWPTSDQVHVWTRLPSTLFRHSILISTSTVLPVDFYNVFDQPNSSVLLNGISIAPGNVRDGYFANKVPTGLNPNAVNTVTITPWPTHTFKAKLQSKAGAPPLSNLTVSCSDGWACDGVQTGVSQNASGTADIVLTGFMRELNGSSKPNQFLLQIAGPPGGALSTLRVTGQVLDSLENTTPIPNMPLMDRVGHTGAANGAGSFSNVPIGSTAYAQQILVTFTCGAAGSDCTPVPNTPIDVDSRLNTINLLLDSRFNGSTYRQYYSYAQSMLYYDGASVPSNRLGLLTFYGLTGRVFDAITGQPVSGIKVCDKNWQLDLTVTGTPLPSQPNPPYNGQCVLTDAGGSYTFRFQTGSIPALVSNRYLDTLLNKNYGFVDAYIPSGQTSTASGKTYAGGDTGPVLIPLGAPPANAGTYSDLTPTAPNTNPIFLPPAPGSI